MKYELSTCSENEMLTAAGYNVRLCETICERLKCPLCHHLMKDPVQTYRGELACSQCYAEAKKEDGRCPIDGQSIKSEEVFRDKAKRKEISALDCYCMYVDHGCTWNGKVHQVEEHQGKCKFCPHKCHLCHHEINPSTLDCHLDFCNKWLLEKTCIYEGCVYKPENVADLKVHLQDELISHAMMQASAIKKEEDRFQLQLGIWQEKEMQLQSTVEQLKEQMSSLMKHTTDMQKKHDSTVEKLEDRIVKLEKNVTNQSKEEKSERCNLNDSSDITGVSDAVSTLTNNFVKLHQRQQLLENTSYDGKLLWKIDNVSQRMHKAVTGSVTTLHSAPVFTSKYGFKFCGRLYLNGDGLGKSSHVSLFFALMKSEYDNLLQWPFSHQVTFRLINQVNTKEDITETFYPDPLSSSFSKPTNDMNIASGCPLFVEKEKLLSGGFVTDDSLFIEISVC